MIKVSTVQFYNTSSIYCIVCSPPQVKSPSFTLYPPSTYFYLPQPPFFLWWLLLSIQTLLEVSLLAKPSLDFPAVFTKGKLILKGGKPAGRTERTVPTFEAKCVSFR